jgi:hypothetical protein
LVIAGDRVQPQLQRGSKRADTTFDFFAGGSGGWEKVKQGRKTTAPCMGETWGLEKEEWEVM